MILMFRNTKAVFGQIVLPVAFALVALILQKVNTITPPSKEVIPLQFNTSMYAGPAGGPLRSPFLVFDASSEFPLYFLFI